MASYSENYKIIKDALQKAFSEEDLSIRFQNIKIVQSQINDYLERYRIISSDIKQRYEILAQEMPDQSEMTRRYHAIKSFNNEVDSIQDLLKQGYLYVDALREIFTGQSITYQIGIENNGILCEGTLDILEIIEHSTLDIDSKVSIQNAAKLRMTKITANQLHNSSQLLIEKNTDGASSVYSAVYNYLTATLHETPKKLNSGNAYQTYRRVLFQRGGKNKIPPSIDGQQIVEIYEQVKRNNTAYYKGGDILNIQVKYLGGRPASLTTLASIKRVLEKSNKALDVVYKNSKPKKALVNSFTNLFTQKQSNIFTEIEKEANEKAKQSIKEKLYSIQGLGIIS